MGDSRLPKARVHRHVEGVDLAAFDGKTRVLSGCSSRADTADFCVPARCERGIPYWDTGAPGLGALGDWGARPAEPFNDHEPVDSSAAAIAAQGLLRLGHWMDAHNLGGEMYTRAGLVTLGTLFDPGGPYLSSNPGHEGLLLHSVYHWPNGWDHVPSGSKIPRGESSQWGDYHAREAALYLLRLGTIAAPYLTFFGPAGAAR